MQRLWLDIETTIKEKAVLPRGGVREFAGSHPRKGLAGKPAEQKTMEAFSCVLAFDTTGPDFVRGVEVGRLWETLKASDGPVEEIVHASNAEMILRLSEATERPVRSEELDEIWLLVTFDAA